jgi:hypothetical protein
MRINFVPPLLALLLLGAAGAAYGQAPMGVTLPATGAIVSLRAAASSGPSDNGNAGARPAANDPAPATTTPPVPAPAATPMPTGTPRPVPDVVLTRISTINGVQKATLYVKGVTRSGLKVGDRVLKQVLSEFRDDGVCLDASLQRPRCATFVAFNYD